MTEARALAAATRTLNKRRKNKVVWLTPDLVRLFERRQEVPAASTRGVRSNLGESALPRNASRDSCYRPGGMRSSSSRVATSSNPLAMTGLTQFLARLRAALWGE